MDSASGTRRVGVAGAVTAGVVGGFVGDWAMRVRSCEQGNTQLVVAAGVGWHVVIVLDVIRSLSHQRT